MTGVQTCALPISTYKTKANFGSTIFMLGVTAFNEGVRLQDNTADGSVYTYEVLLSNVVHSVDGGKTWKPCGVEE